MKVLSRPVFYSKVVDKKKCKKKNEKIDLLKFSIEGKTLYELNNKIYKEKFLTLFLFF